MIPSNTNTGPKCLEIFVRKSTDSKLNINQGFSKIPDYAHTRLVMFREVMVEEVPHTVFSCKCYHFKRKRCACRHFFAVLDSSPKIEHFYPDCLKEYEVEYAEAGSEIFSKKCDDLIEMHDFYGGMLLKKSFDEVMVELNQSRQLVNESFFLEAHNNLHDNNPLQHVESNFRSVECGPSTKRKKKFHPKDDAYNRFYKRFRDMTSVITMPEQFAIMEKSMNATYRELLEVQKKSMKDEEAVVEKELDSNEPEPMRLLSFPEVDKRVYAARKKPFNSPTKFK